MLNQIYQRSGFKKDVAWSRFVIQWLTISLILHLIAAVRSVGFYHPDEHFQIVELMNYKFSGLSADTLPFEFHHQLSPWLFPTILYGITKFFNAIGISSPFDWALSYRLLSALIGWVGTVGLSLCCFNWFADKKWKKAAVVALNLIWYLPALHARHSSENLGGSLFLIGLTFYFLATPAKSKFPDRPGTPSLLVALITGILFGLAFEFRYEAALMIFGAVLWLLVMARPSFQGFLVLGLGIAFSIGLGSLADHWGYGNWNFTAKNYLYYRWAQNSINPAPPVWDYFRQVSTESWPILGILTFLSFLVAWARHPKHVLSWSLLPFFGAMMALKQKELHFLFPMLHAGGLLLVMSAYPWKWKTTWHSWPLRVFVSINLLALIVTSLIPAWEPVQFYSKLYHFRPYNFEVYYKDDAIFNRGGAQIEFYRPSDVPFQKFQDDSQLIQALQKKERPIWLFTPHFALSSDSGVLKTWCQAEFSTLPSWVEKILDHGFFSRVSNWTLHRCQSPDPLKSRLSTS